MIVSLSVAWRAVLAVALGGAIVASARVRAPGHKVPTAELHRLVFCALVLYAVGALATLNHRPGLAGIVYGAGIVVSALAAWLSRGRDHDDPRDGREPLDQPRPPEPDVDPAPDWATFEREFRDYARRVSDRA